MALMSVRDTAYDNIKRWARSVALVYTESTDPETKARYIPMDSNRKVKVANKLLNLLSSKEHSHKDSYRFLWEHYDLVLAGETGLGRVALFFQGTSTLLKTVADEITVQEIQTAIREGLMEFNLTEEMLAQTAAQV